MTKNQLDFLELRFPAPDRPLSINKANTMHWAAKRRALTPWREAAQLAWVSQRAYWHKVQNRKVLVEVELPFPDSRRRDPHNYVGTVVKALIDSLTTQTETIGKQKVVVWDGCWPDDTPEFVETSEPKIVKGEDCVIRLHPVPRHPLPEWWEQ